jgi:hypothetical protein
MNPLAVDEVLPPKPKCVLVLLQVTLMMCLLFVGFDPHLVPV